MATAKRFTIRGVELMFVRRRYGKRIFTWLHYMDDADQWREYGDPWPHANPSKADLHKAVDTILAMYPLPEDDGESARMGA